MKTLLLIPLVCFFTSCSHQYYYVVRHAEKETSAPGSNMMNSDPPLSEAGKQRAEALATVLASKKIGHIFSTNFNRTKSTAEPTRALFNLTTEIYAPMPDSTFIAKLKSLNKNTLVVGHSNTIDDVVNKLCGSTQVNGDLPETEYNNLFIIKRKGKKINFQRTTYGR